MVGPVLLILVILSLLPISYQDFRFRAVSWYLFPISFLLIVIRNLHQVTAELLLENLGLNMLFILIQVSTLLAYFAIKKISVKQFLNQYMGIGDLLFFVLMSVAIPFPALPVFMVFSLVLSLFLGITSFKNKTIPLAGIQAFLLAGILVLDETRILENAFSFYVW